MKSEIKSGAFLGYVNIFVQILVTFIYTPFMLVKMGQAEYGLYALIFSIVTYLSVLDMGFGNAMIRYISKSISLKDKENENRINGLFLLFYSIIAVVAILIGIAVFLNINNIFGNSLTIGELHKAKIIMIILVITIALSFPLSIFDSYVMSHEKFKFIKLLNIIKTILIPITMTPLLLCGYKSIAMVIINSVYTLGFHIVTMYYCFKKLNMKINFNCKKYDKSLIKEITAYSFFVFLGIIVDNIFNNTDQVILGVVSGTVMVSVYAVAQKITAMNLSLSTTISGLFLPKMTKLLNDNESDKKISNIFIRVSRIQIYIMLLILSGFFIFGEKFISIWVGKKFIDAYYIVLLLIGPSIIPLTQNIGISVIQAKNIHQFRAVIYIIIAILNISISIPLSKAYGGIGAAVGTAFANFLGQIVTMNIFYWKKAKLDIPEYWRFFAKMFIPTLFVSLVFKFGLEFITNKAVMLLLVFIYICVYYVVCRFNFNKYEKSQIRMLYKKIIRRRV